MNEIFEISVKQMEEMDMQNKRLMQDYIQLTEEIKKAKNEILIEITEISDRKIQKSMENIKFDSQKQWEDVIKNQDSLFKNLGKLKFNNNFILN